MEASGIVPCPEEVLIKYLSLERRKERREERRKRTNGKGFL